MWYPDRDSALSALDAFLPHAGRDYASQRNYDLGPDAHRHVSRLSPWLRLRLLTEPEVIHRALDEHGQSAGEKFIQEVAWRTYFKGWLYLRPSIWSNYRTTLAEAKEDCHRNRDYRNAINGQTGIDCMDAWSEELIQTGYLHNHARMWFASIWTHTLNLPWVLGADFFLRHLLDGDAASNTLGWRWVAGLHTRGKSYLARRSNIRKYTNGRFDPQIELAAEPVNWGELPPHPKPRQLQPLHPVPSGNTVGLLLGEDDLSAARWLGGDFKFAAIAGLLPKSVYQDLEIADTVCAFREACLRDTLSRENSETLHSTVDEVVDWAASLELSDLLFAEPAVGLWDSITPILEKKLRAAQIQLHLTRREWDQILYPHATAGYFKFKKALPKAIGSRTVV